MQKQYKNAYLNLTRHNPLPSNCMPFSSRKQKAQSLTQLLHLNQTIMNMVDPNFATAINQKRKSQAHFVNADKNQQLSQKYPVKRIHPNAAILMSSARHKNQRSKFMSLQEELVAEDSTGKKATSNKRHDLYEDHIDKFMSSKYDKNALIEQYLTNKDQFVKMACQEIQHQMTQKTHLQRSTERFRQKSSLKRLPKIEQFSCYKLKKSTHRAKPADYLRSITHLKKAETLDLRQRQRKQKVFRMKINSLECRLDRIRDQSLG